MFIVYTQLIILPFQIGEISSLGKICLLPLQTILNEPKANLLRPISFDHQHHSFFLKINDIFCLIIFEQNFPYSSVLKTKVFHSGVCLFFTSLTIVLLIKKIAFKNIGQMLSIIFMLPLLQLFLNVLKPSEQNANSISYQNSKQS